MQNTHKCTIRASWSSKFLIYQRGDMYCNNQSNEHTWISVLLWINDDKYAMHVSISAVHYSAYAPLRWYVLHPVKNKGEFHLILGSQDMHALVSMGACLWINSAYYTTFRLENAVVISPHDRHVFHISISQKAITSKRYSGTDGVKYR